jgi:hypothetical protein
MAKSKNINRVYVSDLEYISDFLYHYADQLDAPDSKILGPTNVIRRVALKLQREAAAMRYRNEQRTKPK